MHSPLHRDDQQAQQRHISRQQGFTLIEILVAIALFVIILAAIAGPLLMSLRMSGTSQTSLRATSNAQNRLEQAQAHVTANYMIPAQLSSTAFTAAGLTGVTCTNLNVFGEPRTGTAAACENVGNPSVRRLSVTETISGTTVTLTLDVSPR